MDTQYIAIENNVNAIDDLLLPSQSIKNGELIAIPNNNIFSISADALNEEACTKLQNLKSNNKNSSFTVFISDTNQLSDIIEDINDIEKKLIENFWPGPLTIQFKKKINVPNIISNNSDTINVHMANNKLASDLILLSETPLVVTNTNSINNKSGEKVSYIVNIDSNEFNNQNTVVKVVDSKINIIKQGPIKIEELEHVCSSTL